MPSQFLLNLKDELLGALFGPGKKIDFRNMDRKTMLGLAELQGETRTPILECDFYFLVKGAGSELPEFYKTEPNQYWRILSSSPDFAPATLSWDYMKDALGIPMPQVSQNRCSVSLALPRVTPERIRYVTGSINTPVKVKSMRMGMASTMASTLWDIYQMQFSTSGVLALPYAQIKMDLEVGFSWKENSEENGEKQLPLFLFEDIKMFTPRMRFNPASDQPLFVTFDFVYKSSQMLGFGEGTFPKWNALADVTYSEGQFADRFGTKEKK